MVYVGIEFYEHWKSLGAVEVQAGGSVPKKGVTLTVIGRVRGHRPQVILNILDAKPWEEWNVRLRNDLDVDLKIT